MVHAAASRSAKDLHLRFAIVELSLVTDFEQKEYGAGLAAMVLELNEPR